MIKKFNCKSCQKIFEADGIRIDWRDPIYGSCFKYVAECPDCKKESAEYSTPKTQSSKVSHNSHNTACGCCSKANNCNMSDF